MSVSHSDSSSMFKSDKTKTWGARDSSKRQFMDDVDEKTNHGTPRKLMKKKDASSLQSVVDSSSAKRVWLHEKAAESIIPTEENAKIIPERLYKGLDPLIVHMCVPCKKFNSTRETTEIAEGMVQIPLALCTVCRSHLIAQKNMKFFQHDCPALKKMLGL
ncbi:hypothetical protein GCK72_022677 [Caenorhabditis remanei]|uniref:Uncharacterized protein n=1 Tax=Caenorhabditis remanei TaxID=31234 RepID=A0A6A5FUL8_CAERE|nr:hypothetical protein GCK72_022677 [Caenorhabditis remanei]KAF1746224.1 hypothetical protein GCK72_022677 [Caenorhabditis remanei]